MWLDRFATGLMGLRWRIYSLGTFLLHNDKGEAILYFVWRIGLVELLGCVKWEAWLYMRSYNFWQFNIRAIQSCLYNILHENDFGGMNSSGIVYFLLCVDFLFDWKLTCEGPKLHHLWLCFDFRPCSVVHSTYLFNYGFISIEDVSETGWLTDDGRLCKYFIKLLQL